MLTTTDPTLQPLFEELQRIQRLLKGSGLRAADRDVLGLCALQPLVSSTLHQLEDLTGRSWDRFYRALKADPLQTVDVLSRVSILLFISYLLDYCEAGKPYQKTRKRVVLVLDDSLLPHSWESQQEGIRVLKDAVTKAYVKAHNAVVFYAVIGEGRIAFPLLLQLHDPQPQGSTKVSLSVEILEDLQHRLERWGLSLEGLDLVFDHWYLKPGIVQAAQNLGMPVTSKLAKNENVVLEDGRTVRLDRYLYHLVDLPLHHDSRLGKRGYYWRFFATHKLLGKVLIVVRRRETHKGKYYAYDFLVTTDLSAKAITVLRLLQKRWKVEVFFRESKQHLGFDHCFFHELPAIQLHCRIRALIYLILVFYRRKLPIPVRQKTIGKLKQLLQQPLLHYFQQVA